ncbi:unnamed protein product [Urochloa humidicola]
MAACSSTSSTTFPALLRPGTRGGRRRHPRRPSFPLCLKMAAGDLLAPVRTAWRWGEGHRGEMAAAARAARAGAPDLLAVPEQRWLPPATSRDQRAAPAFSSCRSYEPRPELCRPAPPSPRAGAWMTPSLLLRRRPCRPPTLPRLLDAARTHGAPPRRGRGALRVEDGPACGRRRRGARGGCGGHGLGRSEAEEGWWRPAVASGKVDLAGASRRGGGAPGGRESIGGRKGIGWRGRENGDGPTEKVRTGGEKKKRKRRGPHVMVVGIESEYRV